MSRLVLSVLLCTFAFACVRASPRPPSSSESAETAGETAPLAASAGADVLVAGSAVFGSMGSVAENCAALRNAVANALA